MAKKIRDDDVNRLKRLFQSKDIFLDAAAIKEYQMVAACDNSDLVMETLRKTSNIYFPLPAFEQIEHQDFNAWASELSRYYGLTIAALYYVNSLELPKLSTPWQVTSLSRTDYEVVRYAVYATKRHPGIIIDCATPGVMELYRKEMRASYNGERNRNNEFSQDDKIKGSKKKGKKGGLKE